MILLYGQLIPLFPQLGRAEDVRFPEVMLVGPLEKVPNLLIGPVVSGSHQPDRICPTLQIGGFVLWVQVEDLGKHPLGRLDICRRERPPLFGGFLFIILIVLIILVFISCVHPLFTRCPLAVRSLFISLFIIGKRACVSLVVDYSYNRISVVRFDVHIFKVFQN